MSDDEIVAIMGGFGVVLGGLVALGGAEMAGLITTGQMEMLMGVGGMVLGLGVALAGVIGIHVVVQEVAGDE